MRAFQYRYVTYLLNSDKLLRGRH